MMRDPKQPFLQSELDSLAARWNDGPVLRHLGFRLSYPKGERALIELPSVRFEQRGGLGSDAINGGVLAGMFDFAVGCTALIAPPPLRKNATIQLSITFERPVRGDVARCEAIIERATSNVLFVSARMRDGDDVICSRATGLVSLGKTIAYEEWALRLDWSPSAPATPSAPQSDEEPPQ